MPPPTESVVLEEEIDENYEPNQEEILEYAKWLGMDANKEKELLWLAREGLKAPLPKDWKPCKSPEGEIYYFNFNTGESVWDHPCDEYYKKLYAEEKVKWEKRMVEREIERKRRPSTSAGGSGSGIKPVAQGGVGFKGLQPLGSSLGSLNAPSRSEYGRGGPVDSASAKGGTDEEPKSSAALMAAAAMKRANPKPKSGGDGSASDSSGGELDLEVANISRAAHTREQQASRKQEQHAEWERRLKQDDDAARARTTRDMEERLRRWREECEESEKRQKRMLEEASELATANWKATLKQREDAVKEEGERHIRDVERAMRERTEEFDAKLEALREEQAKKTEEMLRQLTEEADRTTAQHNKNMAALAKDREAAMKMLSSETQALRVVIKDEEETEVRQAAKAAVEAARVEAVAAAAVERRRLVTEMTMEARADAERQRAALLSAELTRVTTEAAEAAERQRAQLLAAALSRVERDVQEEASRRLSEAMASEQATLRRVQEDAALELQRVKAQAEAEVQRAKQTYSAMGVPCSTEEMRRGFEQTLQEQARAFEQERRQLQARIASVESTRAATQVASGADGAFRPTGEAKRAKRNVSFSPDDQKTTLCYSSDDDEPHLAVDVDDDQPESLLAKAKGLMRQHRQYIRERQQLIERTRTEWKESVQAIDNEPDHAERARLRNQLMDAKRVLEVQAKQLNDEARHLRSLKQCIQASSNELKEQSGMRMSAGAAGTSASARAALRSSLDAVARAVAAAHSAASALPRTPTTAWGEPSENRSLSGAQPSGAFFAQLSRYTDERDVARDLLNQHSAWLNTFRSQMNLNGLMKGSTKPLGLHNSNVPARERQNGKRRAATGGMRVKLDKGKELIITIEDIEGAVERTPF